MYIFCTSILTGVIGLFIGSFMGDYVMLIMGFLGFLLPYAILLERMYEKIKTLK